MNEYINTGANWPPVVPDPVKVAKESLKRAKAQAKARRKQEKAAARARAQAKADRELALATLREIAKDKRKYSADARYYAAVKLLER